ncbi:hypothetical protein MRB53_022249 [Persea americana]|uniref:Uncharacterized protein n=1 Tax=Persea americana TaxID=3435 RepID=A0ACC2L6W9_PERAE|nr:hypothetical protein MRB53_022249 [Persea americana]
MPSQATEIKRTRAYLFHLRFVQTLLAQGEVDPGIENERLNKDSHRAASTIIDMGILEDADRTLDSKKHEGHSIRIPIVQDVGRKTEGSSHSHKCEKGSEFDWQPYNWYGDELEACINEVDRSLFRSAVTMANYMVVERHNVDYVLKQFGLKQHVPFPFHPTVDGFLDWQLESFEKLEKMADPSQMNSFVKNM